MGGEELTPEMISELIDGLRKILGKNIRQIILYGSAARQEDTEESDVDIAIILEQGFDKGSRKRFIEWAAEMDLKYEKVFSIIDIEKENMDKWGDVLPFYKNIYKEGVILWTAA